MLRPAGIAAAWQDPHMSHTDTDYGAEGGSSDLTHDAILEALERELARMVRLAGSTDPHMEIPTCPGWDAAELMEHLGGVHRWAAEILRTRPSERISRRGLDIRAPTDGRWDHWIREGADRLLEALAETPADTPLWAWGPDHHARWWARRTLHETVVHGADLVLASGGSVSVEPLVAADCICELLDNTPARLRWPDAVRPTSEASVHLHATDATPVGPRQAPLGDRGEWMVEMTGGGVGWSHAHGKGDTAVRGPVVELMLVMNRRVTAHSAGVEVFGSTTVLDELLAAVGH